MSYDQKLEVLRADLLRLLGLTSSFLTLPDLWRSYMDVLGVPPGNLADRQAYAAKQNGIPLSLYQMGTLFTPQSLFAANQVGAWYDPSDMGSLYQDHAGTTPVTALEQTVALMLDKSRGLVRSAEMLADPEFNGTADWTLAATLPATADISGGKLTLVSPAGEASSVIQKTTSGTQAVATRLYEFTLDIESYTGTAGVHFSGPGAVNIPAGTGIKKVMMFADGTQPGIKRTGTCNIVIRSLSVKEIPGMHVGQLTAGMRPTLSARVNLLTKSEQMDDASWTKTDTTITPDAIAAPDGLVSMDLCTEGSAGTSQVYAQAVAAPGTYTGQVVIVRGNHDWVRVILNDLTNGGQCWVNTSTGAMGTIANIGTGAATTATSALSGNFVTVKITTTIPAGATAIALKTCSASADNSMTRVNGGTRYVGRSMVETGTSASRYQRVNTATDYDSAGFPRYLKFDGVDDGIFTSYVPAGQAFPFTVACAARDGVDQLGGIFGIWGGAPPYYEVEKLSGVNQWRAFVRGAVNYANGENGTSGGIHVLTGEFTSTTVNLRMDGTDPAAATTQDNAFGTITDIRIGNGGVGFFNGNFYGGVLKFGALSTAERINMERFLASKAGITI